ncbi:MAG: tetratricopeptide repeat protein [Bryobacteraceae bacterium]
MARITRKELKSDKFAQEVGLTVDFFEEHRKDVVRYGAIAVAAVLLIFGYTVYSRHQRVAREEALTQGIAIQESPVAQPGAPNGFPTQDAKDQAALKAFGDLASKYSGTDEGYIAVYYIGAIRADEGRLADAEKFFLQVADHASANYASLAKLSLADIYYSDGRTDQAEKTWRDLIAHPTVFVSQDDATITLARHLSAKNPAEARKLLSPIKGGKGPMASMAQELYAELPPG